MNDPVRLLRNPPWANRDNNQQAFSTGQLQSQLTKRKNRGRVTALIRLLHVEEQPKQLIVACEGLLDALAVTTTSQYEQASFVSRTEWRTRAVATSNLRTRANNIYINSEDVEIYLLSCRWQRKMSQSSTTASGGY